MHMESYQEMARLVRTYLKPEHSLRILDVGSYDVNGSYRPIFDRPGWHYAGADVAPGPNVDVVLREPYRWDLPDAGYDVVISGQAFEHIQFFWLTWLEMVRVLKPGGLIFLLAPGSGPEHRYPVDCWRFYRDGMRALGDYGDVEVLEAETRWGNSWADTIGVFRKPARWRAPAGVVSAGRLRRSFRRRARGIWRRLKSVVRPPQSAPEDAPSRHPLPAWILHHQSLLMAPSAPVRWMGVPTLKNALDCWIYQEILYEVRPDVVVELGSRTGGSTLFFCHMLDLLGADGIVVSVDTDRSVYQVEHRRIVLVTGDCADPAVQAQVAAACQGRRVLVVHDADHGREAVLRDLRAYSDLVSIGSYFIVEDGIIDQVDLPDVPRAPGPLTAIMAFLAERDDFVVDTQRERYVLTYNPSGFLKRVRAARGALNTAEGTGEDGSP